jgi:membrane protein YdbS with pleckstrin-like domain
MKQGRIFVGLIFVVLGFLFLLNYVFSYFYFTPANVWPFLLLLLGLGFEMNYFLSSKNTWSLIPGGILVTTGIIMTLQTFLMHWRYGGYTWPLYLLIPIAGLLQFYYFSGKNRKLLIPIFILTAIAAVSAFFSLLAFTFHTRLTSAIIALILIAAGVCILFRKQDLNRKQS